MESFDLHKKNGNKNEIFAIVWLLVKVFIVNNMGRSSILLDFRSYQLEYF